MKQKFNKRENYKQAKVYKIMVKCPSSIFDQKKHGLNDTVF